jgi:hypothetical protein
MRADFAWFATFVLPSARLHRYKMADFSQFLSDNPVIACHQAALNRGIPIALASVLLRALARFAAVALAAPRPHEQAH